MCSSAFWKCDYAFWKCEATNEMSYTESMLSKLSNPGEEEPGG